MVSLLAVIVLFLLAYVLTSMSDGFKVFFGVIVPYAAVIVFLVWFWKKVLGWARSAVPFKIPTTSGQGKSMDWIKPARFDNPFTNGAVIVRMALEVLVFRSLFRNLKLRYNKDKAKVVYTWELWLWLFALAFHWAFFCVAFRHMRFFTEPVFPLVTVVEYFDAFLRIEFVYDFIQIGLPGIYTSGIVLLGAAIFLLLRRMLMPQVKYISLPSDYFPLFLIIGIAISGIMMRYFTKTDIVAVKSFTMGLATFNAQIPDGVGGIFYVHLFLVSVLLAYFPFSKLMHMGGIFMSPTRNMANDSRAKRYVNPWNYPVHVHTYEEYEDEFRERMIEAGLPVEKKE